MERLFERFWIYIAQGQSLSMQEGVYRLLCLLTGILCLGVILPLNLFQNLPVVVFVTNVALGLIALGLFFKSKRGGYHASLFLIASVILLDLTWFSNAGSQGSVSFFFFICLTIGLVLIRGQRRWWVALMIGANLSMLLLIEHYHPDLVTPFASARDRLIDQTTGVFCAMLALTLIVWVITNSNEREHSLAQATTLKLAASEKHYRDVVENASTLILRIDRQGRITFFNRYAEELFGYERQEILGKPFAGTLIPETSAIGENLAASVENLFTNPSGPTQVELEGHRRDGRSLWIHWSFQPIFDDRNALLEILSIGVDVTERKSMMKQLELIQRTIDAASEGILWTDEHGRILYTNTAAAAMLGYSEPELRQLRLPSIAGMFQPEDWTRHWDTLKQKRSLTMEALHTRKDGTAIPVETSMIHMRVDGREYGAAFIRDITERRRAEVRRQQQEQQLTRMQRLESLGVLAGGIAHDFNNLLTAILGNTSLLNMTPDRDPMDRELLTEVEHASRQARELTMQLLTFAKGGKPVRASISLEQVVRASASLVLRGSNITSAIQIAPDCWPAFADASQLGQVVNSLLINALQAMPDGGRISIEIMNRMLTQADGILLPKGRYVQLSVRDQGSGIPEEHLQKIFDPYFSTKAGGSGLGLAVAFSIIRHHGGHVSVESAPGAGSTFTILLPAASEPVPEQRPTSASPSAGAARVLIMDDERSVRQIVTKLLQRIGYEAVEAPDGASALALYQEAIAARRPFSAVILDLTIPGGMGGKETIRHLREMDPNVKAIVSSGYSHDPVMADHNVYGFAGVIRKPYTPDEFRSVLQKVLTESPASTKLLHAEPAAASSVLT